MYAGSIPLYTRYVLVLSRGDEKKKWQLKENAGFVGDLGKEFVMNVPLILWNDIIIVSPLVRHRKQEWS